MVTKEDVMRVVKNVKDPEIGASIVSLGMVKAVEVQGSTVHVEIALTIPNCPLRETIKDDVVKAVSGMKGVVKVEVQLSSMTDQERGHVSQTLKNRPTAEQSNVQQTWRSQPTGIERLPKGKIEEYKSPEFAPITQRLIEKTRQLKVPQQLRSTEKSTERESGR